MPRFIKDSDGRTITVDTSIPREAAQLRAEGFTEQKASTAVVKEADAAKAEALKPTK